VPRQDQQGRWISDDGLQYWDGSAWRPFGPQAAPARRSSAMPVVLIGCGFALVILLVIAIGAAVMVGSSDFQRGFCNGWANSNPDQACPFHPASP
jgi:hypothetical protein